MLFFVSECSFWERALDQHLWLQLAPIAGQTSVLPKPQQTKYEAHRHRFGWRVAYHRMCDRLRFSLRARSRASRYLFADSGADEPTSF
jgi:hypothetical protein